MSDEEHKILDEIYQIVTEAINNTKFADEIHKEKLLEKAREFYNNEKGEWMSMTDNEKTFNKNPRDKKDYNNSLMIPRMRVAWMGNSQPNIALEKEVAYLHGKVDTIEKIIMERK